ncbi:MAG TPA: FGGY-family carbohydrate kinase [Stellaceae bacterium]|nr:FGGY-family carbohydrate kinase [Stellaceae bacterium]
MTPPTRPLFVGIDAGTSGVRAIAIDEAGRIAAQGSAPLPPSRRSGPAIEQDPADWWRALTTSIGQMIERAGRAEIAACAVDGTSGTILFADRTGTPLGPALLYNDARAVAQAERIAAVAPSASGAHGPTSALAKLLHLQPGRPASARHLLHQADWLAGRLTGRFGVSDENNVLKLGYDGIARRWPGWFDALGVERALLPEVVPPGTPIGRLGRSAARELGLPEGIPVVAGTTDGVAAFLATGAHEPGDGVTSLGSTLVIKLLTDRPIFSPADGIYSHRLGELWLPGGAANTGGAALLRYFDRERMIELSRHLDPAHPTGLDYWPLPGRGERFPINAPDMESAVDPRPRDDAQFLQGLLEGIANVERRAYTRLAELGAPSVRTVRTVGSGADNAAWSEIRAGRLKVPMPPPISLEAAYGTALLARRGVLGR